MEDTLVVIIIALFLSIVALLIIGFCLFKGKRTQQKVSRNENNLDTEGEDDLGSFETYDKLDFSFERKREENAQLNQDLDNESVDNTEEPEEEDETPMVTIPMPESIKTDIEEMHEEETREEENKVEEKKEEQPIFETNLSTTEIFRNLANDIQSELAKEEPVEEQEETEIEEPKVEEENEVQEEPVLSTTQIFHNLANDIQLELDKEETSEEQQEESEVEEEQTVEEPVHETEVQEEETEDVEEKLSNTQIIRNLSADLRTELENGNYETTKPDLSKRLDFFSEARTRVEQNKEEPVEEKKEEPISNIEDVVNVQIKGKNYIFLANGNNPNAGEDVIIILNGREYPATITKGVYQKDINSLKIKPKDLIIK